MSVTCECSGRGIMKCPPGHMAVCYDNNGKCEGNCYPLNDNHDPLVQMNFMLNAISQHGNRLPVDRVTEKDLDLLASGIYEKFSFRLPSYMVSNIDLLKRNNSYLKNLNLESPKSRISTKGRVPSFRGMLSSVEKKKRTWAEIFGG